MCVKCRTNWQQRQQQNNNASWEESTKTWAKLCPAIFLKSEGFSKINFERAVIFLLILLLALFVCWEAKGSGELGNVETPEQDWDKEDSSRVFDGAQSGRKLGEKRKGEGIDEALDLVSVQVGAAGKAKTRS